MKREIKFRGRMVHYDGWVYGNLLLSTDGGASIWPIESDKLGDVREVGNGTIGQFTGLLDKNGREIYEGDIIHNSNRTLITLAADPRNYIIKWVEGEYNDKNDWLHIKPGFVIEKIRPVGTPRYMELIFNQSQIEVIGNIHENPELL